jgi:hypothetical protein
MHNYRKTIVNAIMPNRGFNRKAPHAIVFGTSTYGGFELDHLVAVQGFGWIQYLMGHLRYQDGTGKLMQIIIEFTQVECGSLEPIFTLDYDKYMTTILTRNWATEIWAYLCLCKGKVNISGTWKSEKQLEGDQALMEISFRGRTFSASEIKELNRCRIYLQMLLVSDITDINGKYISPWTRCGKRCMERNSVWDWTIQQRPTKRAAWKTLTGIISQYNTLFEPLGQWITTKGHQR